MTPARSDQLLERASTSVCEARESGEGAAPVPDSLSVPLPELGETLRPTYAVQGPDTGDGEWLMLIHELPLGLPLEFPFAFPLPVPAAGVLVLFFCAQGGRLGSSCARPAPTTSAPTSTAKNQ